MKNKSLRKFKFGFKQIIFEVVTGLLTTLVLQLLSHYGYLPDSVAVFVNIFLIVANVLLAWSMLSWGIFYMVGWLIGSAVFFELGLFGTWDIVLYIVLPLVVLVARITLTIKRKVAI